MTALLAAALGYAARGRRVLAVEARGKRPLTCRGLHDASTREAEIREWWRRWPNANIGLACGAASGFWTLDVDPRSGGHETLDDLLRVHGQLPETREAFTGGGGRHLLFRWPGNVIGRWRGKLGAGIDVKASGYIVAPPSVHPSGVAYSWSSTAPLAPAPAWLLGRVIRPANAPAPASERTPAASSAFMRAAVEREVARVATAPKGERNNTLNSAAFALGGLVACGLAHDVAGHELLVAACACGLTAHEARRTIASGLASGARHPRSIPSRRSAA